MRKHDPWPYVQFILYIFKLAYKEFEERLTKTKFEKGEKRNLIIESIEKMDGSFSVRDIQLANPEISIDSIRLILKNYKK